MYERYRVGVHNLLKMGDDAKREIWMNKENKQRSFIALE